MGGGHPEAPPPGGGPPRLHAPALVPVCSAVKASVPPPPCDRAPPSSRSLAETWGAASRRAPGTATRGPRAGVGPQSGDRLLSRCHPQRSSVPRRAVAQKIRFCPEAQPAQPWASYGSAADEGQRETLTPRHRSHVRVGRLLPTSKRPWDAGARPPLHCPRGEKRGPGGSRRPHQGGSWVLPPPCGQGPWPGSSSGILARVPTCPRHLSSGASVGSCSTQGPQVLCKAAPRGLISMWPSGEAALLCDKFITCGIVLVGYEKSAVAW